MDTGESRLIKGVTGDVVRVPLVEVDLQSKYGTGKYLFALFDRLPKPLRAKILKLAHDVPAAAHLGMIKTKKRLEQHFYWPSMSEDIKLYIRTCDV